MEHCLHICHECNSLLSETSQQSNQWVREVRPLLGLVIQRNSAIISKTFEYDANFSWLVWVRHSMVRKVKVFRGTPIVWAVLTYPFWRRSSLQAVSFLRISWSLNSACVGKGFYYSRDRVGRPSMTTWLCSGHLAKRHFLAWFPRRVW